MKKMASFLKISLCISGLLWFSAGQAQEMAKIDGGSYLPLYGNKEKWTVVEDFYLDKFPVTNAEFLVFVKNNPAWRRDNIVGLFADENYLNHWQSPTALGNQNLPNAPVTAVSWFAAKKYCECQGKRLPTLDEWEYAAMASESLPDARKVESYNEKILGWYETPKTYDNPVGSTFRNYWGVYDMHGLVWEWTSDFNSVLLSNESRSDSSTDLNLFCGNSAASATDLMNYAAFMRYAFRSSVKARYTIKNLGFRCAANPKNEKS